MRPFKIGDKVIITKLVTLQGDICSEIEEITNLIKDKQIFIISDIIEGRFYNIELNCNHNFVMYNAAELKHAGPEFSYEYITI